MPKLKVSLKDFDKALQSLNEKLVSLGKFIEIRSIGGYAMMRHGLRLDEQDTGYTEDIDSITDGYEDDIRNLLVEVAKELDLLPDWLNSDSLYLPEVSEVKNKLNWIEDKSYSNITLYYADLLSLLLLKVRAIEGGGLVPRKTDKNDMIKILKHMDVYSIQQLKNNKALDFIKQYQRCYEYLVGKGKW